MGERRLTGVSRIRSALGNARPKRKLGQTFMIDPNLLSALVRDADVGKEDVVLEIGTGTGRLTEVLARAAGPVLTVEIDRHLARISEEKLSEFTNVEIMNTDILEKSGAVAGSVGDRLAALANGKEPVVVANLPYSASGRIIAALLLWKHRLARSVVTVQKEVAQRLTASPGSKAYGRISVLAQVAAKVEMLRTIPPECFWPRPAVDSAVVRIGERKSNPDFLATISTLAAAVFQHRRKTIRNALLSATNIEIGAGDVSSALGRAGIDEGARGDSLTTAQYERLAALFSASARSSSVLTLKKLSKSGSSRRNSSPST
jgi:16S rRNA (adenine1518-N6/adenine1519-N6)-dimethyltransferase